MEKYVIVTLRHRDIFFGGNAHLFWGPDSSGYTAVLETAGVYTKVKAKQIFCEDDVPIPISAFGMTKDSFVKANGFKELETMTIVNYENKEIKILINKAREAFREYKEGRGKHECADIV